MRNGGSSENVSRAIYLRERRLVLLWAKANASYVYIQVFLYEKYLINLRGVGTHVSHKVVNYVIGLVRSSSSTSTSAAGTVDPPASCNVGPTF